MEMLLPCCAHIHSFLQANELNVAAIHCKAGKGRTGLIIICYLVFAGLCVDALVARALYDNQRTKDGKGLTIISQIRYVHYFAEQLRRIQASPPPAPPAAASSDEPSGAGQLPPPRAGKSRSSYLTILTGDFGARLG
jgi:hypothetical protein